MTQSLWKIARIFYGLPLAITGLIYLTKPQGTVESLVSFIPGGLFLIYVAGFIWVILGLAITFDIKTRLASWGVLILLGFYLMMIHIPAAYTGEYLNVVWFELLRNLSLMAGAVFLLSYPQKNKSEENLLFEKM